MVESDDMINLISRGENILLLLFILFPFAGCRGGTAFSVDGLRQSVIAPYRAISQKDARSFCKAFTSVVQKYIALSGEAHAGNCASRVQALFDVADNLSMWAVNTPSVTTDEIATTYRTAYVYLSNRQSGTRSLVSLERSNDKWLISTRPIIVDVGVCVDKTADCAQAQTLWFFMGDAVGHNVTQSSGRTK